MKILHLLFLVLLGLNLSACSRDNDVSDTDDLDLQREEEYQSDDIRDHELDINN